jgi:hypothetical protein
VARKRRGSALEVNDRRFFTSTGVLSASRREHVTFTRPLNLGLVIAPPLVSLAGLSSERTGSPKRRRASALHSARSGRLVANAGRARLNRALWLRRVAQARRSPRLQRTHMSWLIAHDHW